MENCEYKEQNFTTQLLKIYGKARSVPLVQQVVWGKLLGKPNISLGRTRGQCIRNLRFIDCDEALGLKFLEQRSEFSLGQLLLEQRADCVSQCLERSWLCNTALLQLRKYRINLLKSRFDVR